MNGFETILPFLKPIEHLLRDDSISEVMVNGACDIFIEKRGFLEQVQGVFLGEKALMVAVKNIARRLGDEISESKPILDSRLPDGSRVAAVIPPCSLDGVVLTIRVSKNGRLYSKEAIGKMVPRAEKLGVSLNIENIFFNGYLLSPQDMIGFVDGFKSKHVRAHFDTGNIMLFQFPEHWVPILGRRIKERPKATR